MKHDKDLNESINILNNIKNSYRNRDSLVNIFEILRNFLKCFLSLKSHFVIIYLIWKKEIMEILKVENLKRVYGTGASKVVALDNVSFTVEKGEFVSIVGASGSGKSTLLHLIGGVDRPTSGKVFINDEDIYKLNNDDLAIFRRRQIGLIYQFYNLIPILNVIENISLPLELDGRKPDKKDLNEMIELLGLENRKSHLPSQLSGGEQQRVSIGRALITRPSLILADEPTGNLDSKASEEIVNLLKKTNKKYNQTIIMITHNLEIAKMTDRIITIEDGRIVDDKWIF